MPPAVREASPRGSQLPADPLCFGVRRWAAGSALSSALCVVSSQKQAAAHLRCPVLELHLRQLSQPHLPRRDQVRLVFVEHLSLFLFFLPVNQISVGMAHSNLISVSIFFNQTNPEPSEAEDSNHSSCFWGCQCSWWPQWTVFSELQDTLCSYFTVVTSASFIALICVWFIWFCVFRVRVPSWRPSSAGCQFHLWGRGTHCWERLPS